MARRQRDAVREANERARRALVSAPVDAASGHLGDLAWWDLVPGWRDDASHVASVFAAHGLDPAVDLPSIPDYGVAFGRAVRAVDARIRERGYRLIDAAKGANGERRVAVVLVQANGKVTTTDEGTCTCPTDGTSPYVERADPSGIAGEIVHVTSSVYHKRYTTDDLRTAIVCAIERWAGLPCRAAPPHVVYWIPSAGSDAIRRVSDAIEACNAGRVELFAGYAHDERSARACVNAVNSGLEAKLSEFKAECEKYAGADPAKTRVSTIESRIEDAKRLKAQGALYRDILGAAVTSIDERIGSIEHELRRTLGIVEAAHA